MKIWNMRKKIFLLLLFFFFWQISFWPAIFGFRNTPEFLLAFLVVLSGRISYPQTFFWFLVGGILIGYFSPWPLLVEASLFLFIGGGIFWAEKIFLWQKRSWFLEATLLLFSQLFLDGTKWLLSKFFDWLEPVLVEYERGIFLKDYLLNLGIFILFGLSITFLLSQMKIFSDRHKLPYYR